MKKIVVVDDEFIILQGISHLIDWENHGYEIVLETQSPRIALDYIQDHPVDIVLSDIVMPSMSGLDLLKEIKRVKHEVHVVIISSYEEFSYAQEALRLGASDYIVKSTLNPDQILNTINALEIHHSKDTAINLDYLVTQDLKALLLNKEKSLNKIHQYFKEPYFKLIFIQHQDVSSLETFLMNHRHLTLNINADVTCVVLNLSHDKSFQIKDLMLYFYTDLFEDISLLSEYISLYNYQANRHFYLDEDGPIYLDSSFIWHKNLNFDFKRYEQMVHENKLFHALDFFYQFLYKESNRKTINPDELKSFASTVIYRFITGLERNKLESQHIDTFKLQLINSIQSAPNLKEFIKNINISMNNLSIVVQEYLQSSNKLKDNIQSFLEDNYHIKLSLKDTANHFNFSYHYMSELFNNTFEDSFNDTLNKIRINKAKPMLEDLSISLQEISQSVGYANYPHFSKIFKDLTGFTPSEYRRKY